MTHEALPRWMAIPIDWKRKDLERLSPLILLILFPRSSRNWTACGPNGPRVSAPIGMKWKSVRCRYLWIFWSHSLYSLQNTMVSFEYYPPSLKFHNRTDIVQPCRFHSFWSEVVSWKIFAGSFFALKKCNRTIVFTFSSCRYTLVSSVAKSN
jgi:hypothetical protein